MFQDPTCIMAICISSLLTSAWNPSRAHSASTSVHVILSMYVWTSWRCMLLLPLRHWSLANTRCESDPLLSRWARLPQFFFRCATCLSVMIYDLLFAWSKWLNVVKILLYAIVAYPFMHFQMATAQHITWTTFAAVFLILCQGRQYQILAFLIG